MPSFVGAFKVVSNGGTLNNGDTLVIAPTSSTKSYNGAGSGVTGDLSGTISVLSVTLTNDPDIVDSSANKVATGT